MPQGGPTSVRQNNLWKGKSPGNEKEDRKMKISLARLYVQHRPDGFLKRKWRASQSSQS